ncbi:hypothetical protein LXL04_030935 [Taraxacum kok-saghyz]
MGQIVRRKRRGRPSNTDRARINYSATPPSPVDRRRSRRRRNVRYNFDIDDYVDDDEFYSDEDEEVGRREKKLRLLLCEDDSRSNTRRVRHAPTSSSSDDYYEEDDVKHSKKRKIDAGGREDDEDNEVEEIRGRKLEEEDDEEEEQEQQVEEEEDDDEEEEEEALGGSASEFSKDVPLPDKKTLQFILEKLQKLELLHYVISQLLDCGRKDTYGVYSEPVDPDELPDYHDVIKHPMDFSTVRKKLAKGSYLTLKQFESDVFLICTNAMQYNAPDTIYYKQASSIQEQAKLRFQRLRANVDRSETEQINTDHRIPPSFSFSPPKKQLKKPVGRPVVHDPIGSETLSGANVRIEEFTNGSSVKTPVRLNSSEAINAENYSVPDESLDKEQELVTGKGSVSKLGTKPVHDENRRATYNTCVENSVAESDSIFTIFEGESKQFIPVRVFGLWIPTESESKIPFHGRCLVAKWMEFISDVGLHADHSYARSLSRFASTLGSVAWKVASQTIQQSLPAGVKYGRGWVGEYEPLPTTVTIMPGDYTLKEASRRNSNSLLTTLEHNLMKPLKNESVRSEQQPIKDPKNPFFNFSSEGPTPHVDIITRKPDIISSPRPSVNHLNIPNDGFAPGRPSQGNATKVSGPVQRMPSFNQPNIQNDGFAPRRPSQGNATLVGKEQPPPPPPPGMIPSFRYRNGQNDGFAPGRPSQGNTTLVGREQQQQLAFCHPNGQNDGFAPGRPSQGNATFVGREQQQPPPGMIPSFRHPNDGFTPGRPSQGNLTPLSREQPPFNHPSKLASEPGLSDPVQMMKMLAERTHNQGQSQSQQNSLKREESGAQAWMSLGGTHKQPIVPPPVVDSLNNNNNNNNTRYQPQATRFRGEVQFQGDKNSYQQPQHFPQLVTADLSRFQVQPSWRGVTPQMQQQFRPKQQESCPPDLNIGYQSSPVRQSTAMMVDSQQPDLALQL